MSHGDLGTTGWLVVGLLSGLTAVAAGAEPKDGGFTADVSAAQIVDAGISGVIDRLAVSNVIRAHQARTTACFEAFLLRSGDERLPGKLVVRFTIGIDGRVSLLTLDQTATLRDAALVRCVLAAFSEMRFTPPTGGPQSVVYPFIF